MKVYFPLNAAHFHRTCFTNYVLNMPISAPLARDGSSPRNYQEFQVVAENVDFVFTVCVLSCWIIKRGHKNHSDIYDLNASLMGGRGHVLPAC